jgi:hypothetical protein
VSVAPAPDLSARWLQLLGRLTERFPDWGLWKNADAALAGHGDFDSTAPASDWDEIGSEFAGWATANGYGPVAGCRHVPGVLFLVALDRERRALLELDVNGRKYFRGWTMFRPENLAPMMEIDSRGFRRVRPGTEGVILLVQNGLKWGGRPDPAGLARKKVAEILRRDPEGVRLAASLFAPAGGPALRAARAAAEGDWDRTAMLAVEARAVAGALAAPGVLWGRLRSRGIKQRCPLLRTIFADDRTLSGDADEWVSQVARSHRLLA